MLEDTGTGNSISSDIATFHIDDSGSNDSDTASIDVTPNTMATTITKVDTGDGTSWFSISPTSQTGDFTLTVTLGTPPSSDSDAKVRISDNAGNASSLDLNVDFSHIT